VIISTVYTGKQQHPCENVWHRGREGKDVGDIVITTCTQFYLSSPPIQ
jgi:hypothetical protein